MVKMMAIPLMMPPTLWFFHPSLNVPHKLSARIKRLPAFYRKSKENSWKKLLSKRKGRKM
jgi:hypothetical protein